MRIVVKNLPKDASKQELATHFSKKAPVTDVFMLHDHLNQFRRVCFLGYSTQASAEESMEYFNNSYFKNHKVAVELAKESEVAVPNATQLRRALYSRTVVIRNLADGVTEDVLVESLSEYGRVSSVEMNKGSAVVKFERGEDAERALQRVKMVMGRRVRIGNCVEKTENVRKEKYSALFFNFETVVQRTCEMERIDRKELLNLADKNLGSRMALLETNLVDQTKKFLQRNGIHLDKIIGKSETTVILKNADLLGVIDMVKGVFSIEISPSKCLALLKFASPQEAAQCCKEMSMRRHKNDVIYCDFAPVCDVQPEEAAKVEDRKQTNKIVVKNVPFQATQDELQKIFSTYTHVCEVRLPKKADGSHRGFAFVVLDSPRNVDEAIAYFGNSTHLYGRRLVLERAKA